MSDVYLGQLLLVPYNYAPQDWAFCQGQLLPIANYEALFSLLGTTYGGDGQTTFALPDLRGRTAINQGQGPGLQNYSLGQTTGVENVVLTQAQMPAHVHPVGCSTNNASTSVPQNGVLAVAVNSYANAAPTVQLAAASVTTDGQSLPHNNLQPYLVLNWIISLNGIYPTPN